MPMKCYAGFAKKKFCNAKTDTRKEQKKLLEKHNL